MAFERKVDVDAVEFNFRSGTAFITFMKYLQDSETGERVDVTPHRLTFESGLPVELVQQLLESVNAPGLDFGQLNADVFAQLEMARHNAELSRLTKEQVEHELQLAKREAAYNADIHKQQIEQLNSELAHARQTVDNLQAIIKLKDELLALKAEPVDNV